MDPQLRQEFGVFQKKMLEEVSELNKELDGFKSLNKRLKELEEARIVQIGINKKLLNANKAKTTEKTSKSIFERLFNR